MEGKKAVVVGGGQPASEHVGIGRAIAETFAREGAEVCVVDRDPERADATVKEIELQDGGGHSIGADVGDPASCSRLIHEAKQTMGRIDVLVNNVATEEGDSDPLSLEVDGWQRIMDVNLRAMWLTCRAVLPIMQEQRSGAIVNTSSLGSRASGGSLFAYGLSKAGVDALTSKLAVLFAPWGIRCNSVLPAWVATQHSMEGLVRAGIAKSEEEIFDFARRANPLGRMGSAWDVANAVLFLSADESCHTTGVNFPVDGGATSVVGQYQRPRTAPS